MVGATLALEEPPASHNQGTRPPYARPLVRKGIFVFSKVLRPRGARLAAAARPRCGRKTGAKRARSGPAAPPNSWPRGHPPAMRGGVPRIAQGSGAGGARPWAMRGWSNAQARLHTFLRTCFMFWRIRDGSLRRRESKQPVLHNLLPGLAVLCAVDASTPCSHRRQQLTSAR